MIDLEVYPECYLGLVVMLRALFRAFLIMDCWLMVVEHELTNIILCAIMIKFMLHLIVIDIMISFCSCDLNCAADVIKLNRYDTCVYYICNDKLLFSSKFLDAC